MKKWTVKLSDSFKATQLETVAPEANLRSSGHKVPDCAVAAGTLAIGGSSASQVSPSHFNTMLQLSFPASCLNTLFSSNIFDWEKGGLPMRIKL